MQDRRPSTTVSLSGAMATRLALACLAALVLTGLALVLVPRVDALDMRAAGGFVSIADSSPGAWTGRIALLADPGPYVLAGLALVAVALLRGRVARAAAVAVLLLATGMTTQLLKSTFGHPRVHDLLGSDLGHWPSGHSTAAMTLALCAVLVAPRVLRPAAALAGGAFAIAVGWGVIVMRWHLPADVVGGWLVATGWTAAAVAVLRRVERVRPALADRRAAPRWAGAAAGVAFGAAVAHLTSGHAVALTEFAQAHTVSALVAAALGVMALALAASFASLLRS
jgi:membrane-associated phospholipid phosphatase